MKHTKLLVVALLVALLACLAVTAMADDTLVWSVEKVEPATCTAEGYIYSVGKDLDGNILDTKVEYTSPLGHKWTKTEQVKEATCVAPGEIWRKCERCGHLDSSNVIYSPGATGVHIVETIAAFKDATCTQSGNMALEKCKVCGKIDPNGKGNDGRVIPAYGHDFTGVAWSVDREATCAKEGKIKRKCNECDYVEYQTTGYSTTHRDAAGNTDVWKLITPEKPATCTEAGCKKLEQCSVCGKTRGGDTIAPLGHQVGIAWTVEKEATCAAEGSIVRKCVRKDIYGKECGAVVERQSVPVSSTHGDKNNGITSSKKVSEYKTWTSDDAVWHKILPAVAASCEKPGCTAQWQCTVCGKYIGAEAFPSALGHAWGAPTTNTKPTCLKEGKIEYKCSTCGATRTIKIPATGHTATWQPAANAATTVKQGYVIWNLVCANSNCDVSDKILASRVVKNGETAPSGTITTGKVAVDAAYTTDLKGTTDIAKNSTTTTKTATAKSSTKSSAKSTASSSTKAAAAPATTETKKVATVAAVVAAPAALAENQAQLVADKHLYVVKNVAGEEIVLTVNVADGKITVEANLAEGESLVLYANAEAIDAPTAENTLVLTANEAVELPEAFANAILAVVKTESLPTAVAAK